MNDMLENRKNKKLTIKFPDKNAINILMKKLYLEEAL